MKRLLRGQYFPGSAGRFVAGVSRNTGKVRIAVILSLSVLCLFLLFTTNAPQSLAEDCGCQICHGGPHPPDWSGCSSCHDSPPQTGSHRKHYDSTPIIVDYMLYNDTSVTSTAEAYRFGCGNCHPLDITKHRDGILQVELYNAAAPSGSIKAKNPSNAVYTPGTTPQTYPHKIAGQPNFSYSDGTCSNIYCHSGYTVTSGPVGWPLFDPVTGFYILDSTCNLTYNPYTVIPVSVYKSTPAWGTAGGDSFSDCIACHDFPPNTRWPENQAGVGDSHQHIDADGNGNIHGINMSPLNGPVLCRTCHYGTVTDANTWSWTGTNGNVAVWDPVPLASRILHVNGTPDVAFDTVNDLSYRYIYTGGVWTFNLGGPGPTGPTFEGPPTYEIITVNGKEEKVCSNVACHSSTRHRIFQNFQQKVVWGRPSRVTAESTVECDACHRSIYHEEAGWPDCTPAP